MTTLALAYTRIRSVEFPEINWKKFCLLGFFVFLALFVVYAWQVVDLTGKSFVMSSYGRQIGSVSEENKNLQISFAESSFLGQALSKIQALSFQKTTTVYYVQIPDGSVAVVKK